MSTSLWKQRKRRSEQQRFIEDSIFWRFSVIDEDH
jgi:hypothetical protein